MTIDNDAGWGDALEDQDTPSPRRHDPGPAAARALRSAHPTQRQSPVAGAVRPSGCVSRSGWSTFFPGHKGLLERAPLRRPTGVMTWAVQHARHREGAPPTVRVHGLGAVGPPGSSLQPDGQWNGGHDHDPGRGLGRHAVGRASREPRRSRVRHRRFRPRGCPTLRRRALSRHADVGGIAGDHPRLARIGAPG